MSERVKYFPKNDWACGYNLSKIENGEAVEYYTLDLNDIIELYNIRKYFKNNIRLKTWSDDDFHMYMKATDIYDAFICKFFNTLSDENIIECVKNLDVLYRDDFWELFEQCKLYKKIADTIFSQIIELENISLYDVLAQKKTVIRYGLILRHFLIVSNCSVDILINIFEAGPDRTKLYLPNEITNEDKENIIRDYINSESPNPNTLKKIIEMQSADTFKIDDSLRLAAKRRQHDLIEKIFSDSSGKMLMDINICFSSTQKEVKIATVDHFKTQLTYSLNWIEENLDYPTILNNFIYLFEFTDLQMRSLHVSKKSERCLTDILTKTNSTRMYPDGIVFRLKNDIAMAQMEGYYNILLKNNIRLEDVIEWFYNEYIEAELAGPKFKVKMPSKESTYIEKCMMTLSSMESIIKQFSLFTRYKEIDFELLQMSSNPYKYKDIPSLIKNKYVYGVGCNYNTTTNLLFSDQSILSYSERYKEKYSCFFDLIIHENVNLNDYQEISFSGIEFLKNINLIKIAEDGAICIGDIEKVLLLRDLFINGVVNFAKYNAKYELIFSSLVSDGYIRYGTSLLTDMEAQYYNYWLNRAEFNNGWDLRNKYIHGIQQTTDDDDEHKRNYLLFLRLFVLLVIKINDEFSSLNCECESAKSY